MKEIQVGRQLEEPTDSILKRWYKHILFAPFGGALPIFIYAFFGAPRDLRLKYIEVGIFFAWGAANAIALGGFTIPEESYLKLNNKSVLKVFIFISLVFFTMLCILKFLT